MFQRHLCWVLLAAVSVAAGQPAWLNDGLFKWKSTGPLQGPAQRPDDPCVSVKDPSIVFHDGRWHLFTTIRSEKRTHQIEYSSFADWKDAESAPRHVLTINPGFFCAPQVFYFTPHKKWYLLHQDVDKAAQKLRPAFSTTETIGDPASWSAPQYLYDEHPSTVTRWIDFWIICDATKAHLFFTSNNGQMWRAETKLESFPKGWSLPQVVLRGDIFEASHTYKLKGLELYLTLIEAEAGPRRYFKAYVANSLDGEWKPLAASREKPFAGSANITFDGAPWAESISHGEMLRSGHDEHLEIDPAHLQFLYQGVLEQNAKGIKYGQIPWKLGLLEMMEPK